MPMRTVKKCYTCKPG